LAAPHGINGRSDGGALVAGHNEIDGQPLHRITPDTHTTHHAIQIVIALDGCVAICGKDDGWRESRGTVVRPYAERSFDCNGALGVMVFVDPESSDGAWLSASLRQDITIVADTRLDSIVPELRTFAEQPDDTEDVAALIRGCVHGLRPAQHPHAGSTRACPRYSTRFGNRTICGCHSTKPRTWLSCRPPALHTCSETRSVFRSAGTCCGAN
jgi:hypothetical protein